MPHVPTFVLTQPERSKLEKLTTVLGEQALAEALCVNRLTIARAVAGLGLRRSTATLIRMRLPGVEAEKRVPR